MAEESVSSVHPPSAACHVHRHQVKNCSRVVLNCRSNVRTNRQKLPMSGARPFRSSGCQESVTRICQRLRGTFENLRQSYATKWRTKCLKRGDVRPRRRTIGGGHPHPIKKPSRRPNHCKHCVISMFNPSHKSSQAVPSRPISISDGWRVPGIFYRSPVRTSEQLGDAHKYPGCGRFQK